MSTPQSPDPSTSKPSAPGAGDRMPGSTGSRPRTSPPASTTAPGQKASDTGSTAGPTSTGPSSSTPPATKPGSTTGTDQSSTTTTGDDPLRGSRTSGTWVGVLVAVALLVLLIIFIAQNTDDSPVKFLGWQGEAPVAVLLLAAAVVGMAVTALVGSLRIIQLRRRVKRER